MHVAHTAFCVYTETGSVCVSYCRNLWMTATISGRLLAHFRRRKHAASVSLRHECMNVSAGLSDAYTTLSLLSRLFPCCKSRWNISATIARQAAVHVDSWRKILKKKSKGDAKNIFWQRKIRPLILTKSGRKHCFKFTGKFQQIDPRVAVIYSRPY